MALSYESRPRIDDKRMYEEIASLPEPDSFSHKTWQVLFFGILKPHIYMRLATSSRSGPSHYFRAFFLCCWIPIALECGLVLLGHSAGIMHRADVGPITFFAAI